MYKNINLSSSELRYAGADLGGITKYQLKKSILKFFSTTEKNGKNDPRRHLKNLLYLTFEDEKCKHCTFAKKKN